MLQGKILLTKLQRFSLHDGPGIRTTVFLKGCSIHCPWCCNPENIIPSVEPYWRNGVELLWGKWYSQEDLYNELIKDKAFYVGEIKKEKFLITKYENILRLPGGVTFSGGEALLQIDSCIPVLQKLGIDGIHRTVETSLFASSRQVKLAIDCFDLFYVDIKILAHEKCKEILGGDLEIYLSNLDNLICSRKPIIIRIPIIGGYTDDIENIKRITELLSKYQNYNILKVELLKGHHLGNQKYLDLGRSIPDTSDVIEEKMDEIKEIISKSTIKVEILEM